jgi:hypothetical protein
MTTREILVGARALIAKGFCKEVFRRNERGESCERGAACQWCILGAIFEVHPGRYPDDAVEAMERSVGGHIPTWNDAPERTQADVLAAFDRAIEAQS